MRVVLDQNTPKKLIAALRPVEVRRAYELGWDRLRNGDLLRAAEEAGFDVLLTCDQSLAYQQNMRGRRISVVLLSTNHWPTMRNSIAQIASVLEGVSPGSFFKIECGRFVSARVRRLTGERID